MFFRGGGDEAVERIWREDEATPCAQEEKDASDLFGSFATNFNLHLENLYDKGTPSSQCLVFLKSPEASPGRDHLQAVSGTKAALSPLKPQRSLLQTHPQDMPFGNSGSG